MALAGHRDTHFRALEAFEIGDLIELESTTGTTQYRITSRQVVHESETHWAERSGTDELTLITCFPFDAIVPGGPLRYVIRATAIRSIAGLTDSRDGRTRS